VNNLPSPFGGLQPWKIGTCRF